MYWWYWRRFYSLLVTSQTTRRSPTRRPNGNTINWREDVSTATSSDIGTRAATQEKAVATEEPCNHGKILNCEVLDLTAEGESRYGISDDLITYGKLSYKELATIGSRECFGISVKIGVPTVDHLNVSSNSELMADNRANNNMVRAEECWFLK